MNSADILEAAGTALLIPGVWTQGYNARNASGHFRYTTDKDACSFCAIGAISAILGNEVSFGPISVFKDAVRALHNKINGESILFWNDAKDQTAENVAKTMFEAAAELRANNEKV